MSAADILATIPVELEYRGSGYSRDLFAIWLDDDDNGCDTRAEVLIEESIVPTPVGSCDAPGPWISLYDGLMIESPSDLDIDHVVSLKEAWDSGAWDWTPEQRIAYGNDLSDPRTLIAVSAESNRSKGDRDPSNWIPDDDYLCQFVADWIDIKARWSLSMDQSEHGRLRNLMNSDCPGLMIPSYGGN